MSTLKCQLDWVTGYSGSWLNISSGCVGEVFSEEISNLISGLSKADGPPQCR